MGSCSAISDFVENKTGGRKFNTTNPVFDKYIARFEKIGKIYTKDQYFHIGDIPVNFGDTENPLYDGVCFSYANGEKEIIIKKSWWDKHETKETDDEKQDKTDDDDKEKETDDDKESLKSSGYSLIQESLLFHELGHCRLERRHEENTISSPDDTITIKKSMMSHNIVNANDYRKYKDGYWKELFTESSDDLEKLIK